MNDKVSLPVNLIILMIFTSILSLVSINTTYSATTYSEISLSVITLLLATCAFFSTKKSATKNTKKSKINPYQIIVYLLLFIGLFQIWQQLEIPSLTAISTLLTLLAWAKACELKSNRDVKFIWFLLSVLVAINILLSPQYQVPIAVVGVILLLLTASNFSYLFKSTSIKSSQIKAKTTLKQLSLLTLVSLPFAIVLFVTVPRINLPMQELGLAMGLPITVAVDKNLADKGLGKELSFDDIGEQGRKDSRVLLASLPSDFTQNPQQPLYWRGPVYWRYQQVESATGITEKWLLRKDFNVRSKRQYNGFGSNQALAQMTSQRESTIEYNVILMPHGEYWLYALDLPQTLTGESYLSQDYQLLSIRKVSTMWRYKIKSSLNYQISEKEPQAQLELGLQYPDINPKIKALGEQWQQQFANAKQPAQAIIEQAKQFFTQGKYLYANSKYKYQGENQLDQFLFNRKVGYSQHYASALTLLLRAAKIPARLVAGYRGAEQVGLTNMYTVNDHHAHAWVEAYFSNEQGQASWQRIDPALWLNDLFSSNKQTQESEQTENSKNFEQKNKQINLNNKTELNKASAKQKAANTNKTNWLNSLNQWTLNFDADKQTQLAKKLGIKKLLWWHLLAIAIGLLLLLTSLYYLSLRFINRGKKPAEHVIVYHKLCKKLAKKGITRLPHEGAQSYFNRCAVNQNIIAQKKSAIIILLSSTYLTLAYGKLTPIEYQQALKEFKNIATKV
ncbi:MAG: DUF3488 and transglutaminase-like domain-containing protein [Colwellia sp.]